MTSVTDPTTTTEGTATPPPARRTRRLAVAAAVLAVAAGAVAWITVGTDPASADRQATTGKATASASAAAPSLAAPSGSPAATAPTAPAAADPSGTASAAPSAGKASSSPAAAPAPAGWEPRTFQGVTFSVPPGAVAPDAQDPGNADVPPSFVWTGPSVGDGSNAQITVRILPADQAPAVGPEYQVVTVPGADQAHLRTGSIDSQPPMTAVDVQIIAGGKFIDVTGMFAAGPAGEQMVRDLVASLRIG